MFAITRKLSGKTFVRTFFTQTKPLFKSKRRKPNRTKALLSRDSNKDASMTWNQRELLRLRKKLATADDPNDKIVEPSKRCLIVRPIPFVAKEQLLSGSEVHFRLTELHKEVDEWRSLVNVVDRARLEQEIAFVESGLFPSPGELMRAICKSLPNVSDAKDRKLIGELVSWRKTLDMIQFHIKLDFAFKNQLSKETVEEVKQSLLLQFEDSVPHKTDRILEAVLDIAHPQVRQTFFQKKRDILMRNHIAFNRSRGKSMLPTIWENAFYIGKPILPQKGADNLAGISIGSVVVFLVPYKDGDTKSLGKRVIGLPGDTVQDIHGNSFIVPEQCFWAEGDNRSKSFDSRHFGAVPAQNLRQRIIFIFDPDENKCQFL